VVLFGFWCCLHCEDLFTFWAGVICEDVAFPFDEDLVESAVWVVVGGDDGELGWFSVC